MPVDGRLSTLSGRRRNGRSYPCVRPSMKQLPHFTEKRTGAHML